MVYHHWLELDSENAVTTHLFTIALALILLQAKPQESYLTFLSGFGPTAKVLLVYYTLAIILFFVCLIDFIYVYGRHRDTLGTKSLHDRLKHVLFHVPDECSNAWPHVLGLVTGLLGLCITAGASFGWLVSDNDDVGSLHSFSIGASAFLFAAVVSCVSVWTLWQTMRIDHKVGYRITGFVDLIQELTKEIERLTKDFIETHSQRAVEYHHVALVTTNPFLGMLSYPEESFTFKFEGALHTVARCVNASIAFNREHCHTIVFGFEVICGDNAALQTFHETFYEDGTDKVERATRMTAEVEKRIQDHEQSARRKIYTRVAKVPPTQFLVVGDAVYEFTLEALGQRSEIYDTDVRQDRRAAKKSLATFEILKGIR